MRFKSYEFLKLVYKGLEKQSNQSNFVICFFVAAGNTRYYEPSIECPVKSEQQGGPKHYITDRSLRDMKNSFPHPIKIKEAAEYLGKYIDSKKERLLMDSFEFPSDAPVDRKALAYALATQFNSFVMEDEEELENDVYNIFRRYSGLSSDEIEDAVGNRSRLYNGDDAYIAPYNKKNLCVFCHDDFEYTWFVENSGKVTWVDRKLVNVNTERKGPRTTTPVVEIDTTLPRKAVKITARFEARGFEGDFESKWQMQDKDGRDCFSTIPQLFNFKINVHYKANKTEE